MNSLNKLELALSRMQPKAEETHHYAEMAVSYNYDRGVWQAWLQTVEVLCDGTHHVEYGSVGEGSSMSSAIDMLATMH